VQGEILKVIAKDPAMELAMKTLRGIIHRSIEDGLRAHSETGVNPDIPLPLIVDYLTDSLMSLIKWWFGHGMTHSPEQMDDMFRRLVLPGASAALNGSDYPDQGTRA
jgi:hypothetical protein